MNSRFLLLSWLLVLFAACKKKEDTEPPTITVTSPLRFSSFNVYDFFWVEADISDNKEIKTVDIKILDPDGNYAVTPWHVDLSTTHYHAKQYFYLDDIHLPSGQYVIRVEAYDGTNRKTSFVEINVSEIPRALKRVMLTRANGGFVYIDTLGNGQVDPYFSMAGDYSGCVLDSYWQYVYLQGKYSSPLTALLAQDLSLAWSVPASPNGSLPFYNRITYGHSSHLVYSSNGYGMMKGYNKNNSMIENISSTGGRIPFCCAESGSYVIAEHRDLSSSNHLLSVHYKGSGTVLHSYPTSIKWVDILTKDNDKLILAGNQGTQGELRVYDIATNVLWEPVNVNAGRIYDMVKIDDDNYIIAHETGLLRYTWSNSSLVNITSGNKAQCLAYDVTYGSVLAGEGNFLTQYNPLNGAQGFSYPAIDSIRDILLLFNK